MCKQQTPVESLLSPSFPTSKPRSFAERPKDLSGFQRPMHSCAAILALGGADSRARKGRRGAGRSKKTWGLLRIQTQGRAPQVKEQERPSVRGEWLLCRAEGQSPKSPDTKCNMSTLPKKLRIPQPRPKLGTPLSLPQQHPRHHPQAIADPTT